MKTTRLVFRILIEIFAVIEILAFTLIIYASTVAPSNKAFIKAGCEYGDQTACDYLQKVSDKTP